MFKDFFEKIIPLKKDKSKITDDEWDEMFKDLEDSLRCKEMAFYIAASYISYTISKCDFKVYRNKKSVKDDLYYKLNIKANYNETASRLKADFVDKLLYEGHALVFEYNNNLYVADSFNIDYNPLGENVYNDIMVKNSTKTFTRKAGDVFYFNLENTPFESKVKKLLDSMCEDYKDLLAYAINSFKKTNSEKYILELDNIAVGDKDFKEKYETKVKNSLKDFLNKAKAVFPQYKGYKLENVIKNNSTATNSEDIRNIKKDIMETTAQAFKMPVSMLYGNMTNTKDIISHFLTFTIDPIARMISEEITSNTFSIDDWKDGCYIKVDTTSINHLDVFEISDKIEKTISNGIYSIDDIREKIGESPLNTDFSNEHFITKNYSTVEDFLNGMSDEKGGE